MKNPLHFSWPFAKKQSAYTLPPLPPLNQSKRALDSPPLPPNDLELPTFTPAPQEIPTPPAITPSNAEPETHLSEPEDISPLSGISLWLSNGLVVRTLPDLRDALRAMSEATFHYHVTPERNDFASWVADVIGERDLAMELSHVHKRNDFLNILEKHLGNAPIKRVKKHDYLGVRGNAETITPPKGSRRAIKDNPASARKAISELSSMEDAEALIARLEPKGTMLKELLAKKSSGKKTASPAPVPIPTAPVSISPPIPQPEPLSRAPKSGGRWLGGDSQEMPQNEPVHNEPAAHEIAPLTRPAAPRHFDEKMLLHNEEKLLSHSEEKLLTYAARGNAPPYSTRTKPKPAQTIQEKVEQVKTMASSQSVKEAKNALREARTIVRALKPKEEQRKMKYAIWDAENAIKLATLK